MSPAEIILRIAAPLGTLLIFSAHTLTISALMSAGCKSVSHQNLTGTAVLAGTTLVALAFGGLALPWRRSARGLAILTLLLAGLLLWSVMPSLAGATLAGEPLCAGGGRETAIAAGVEADAAAGVGADAATEAGAGAAAAAASPLQRAWPLLQTAVALLAALQAIRYLRAQPADPSGSTSR